MLITTSLAAVVFTSALAGAAAPVTSVPPITIGISVPGSIPATLIPRILAETDAVWRGAGLTFVWRRKDEAAVRPIDAGPCLMATLRVTVGGRGSDAQQRRGNTMALGWIVFDDGSPEPEIYLSYDNSVAYLEGARGIVGLVDRMPIAERETLLGRAMGRALAHEIGHYLLASKTHTARGLMQATHTASEFFGFERSAFLVDAAQRQVVADRLLHEAPMAMHNPQ